VPNPDPDPEPCDANATCGDCGTPRSGRAASGSLMGGITTVGSTASFGLSSRKICGGAICSFANFGSLPFEASSSSWFPPPPPPPIVSFRFAVGMNGVTSTVAISFF